MLNILEAAFAEMDLENLAKAKVWAQGRMAALAECKAKHYAAKSPAHISYPEFFSVAGGKGWFNVFSGKLWANGEYGVEYAVEKNCKAAADKRNATIIAKLAKIGVTEIGGLEYRRSNDGFNGFFSFQGATIEIRTIIAGGYNVQCLHERTLVYANGKKI